MSRIVLVLAVVAALLGCKKKRTKEEPPAVDFRSDWKSLIEIRDAMCSCNNAACTETVLARKTKWTTELATRSYKPSDVQIKDVQRITDEITNCMIGAVRGDRDVAADPPPPPAKPTKPAAPTAPVTVDQLIALARSYAPNAHPQLVIASIDANYVDAEGKLEEPDGGLTVHLGAAGPTDDPKRRVGAPAKPRPAPPSECAKLVWTQVTGWTSEPFQCLEAQRPFGLCTVTEIWKRAIAKGAPADAVATVQLREVTPTTPRRWVFTVLDEPRKISIQHFFPDDCEPALEKQ